MESNDNNFAERRYSNSTHEVLGSYLLNLYFQYQTVWSVILLTPIVVAFMVYFVVVTLLYILALYLKAYRYYNKLNGYTFTPKSWESARLIIAYIFDGVARFWYGYEIEGMQNIPSEGPALIVFYHGTLDVDWFFLVAKTFLEENRIIRTVGDRFIFQTPGLDALVDCLQLLPGTIDTCADILNNGNLLGIAPGGSRESLFGDKTYPLMWGTRIGFAKVAMKAKVPIIPVFTENIREAFVPLKIAGKLQRGFYERFRLSLVPVYGGFPVKLRTHVGQPIEYDPEVTPEELAIKVAETMKDMIKKHQQLPGSISRSVIQRIRHLFKAKRS